MTTWGDASFGGDSSSVQDQLKNVKSIKASAMAFAALLANGQVVTWGDPSTGGDSSRVQHELKEVQKLEATSSAFAAILSTGRVAELKSSMQHVGHMSVCSMTPSMIFFLLCVFGGRILSTN